jgi:hypothetical protein
MTMNWDEINELEELEAKARLVRFRQAADEEHGEGWLEQHDNELRQRSLNEPVWRFSDMKIGK